MSFRQLLPATCDATFATCYRGVQLYTNRRRLRQECQCFSRSRIRSHKCLIVAGAGFGVKNYRILVIFVQNLPEFGFDNLLVLFCAV